MKYVNITLTQREVRALREALSELTDCFRYDSSGVEAAKAQDLDDRLCVASGRAIEGGNVEDRRLVADAVSFAYDSAHKEECAAKGAV